MELGVYGSVAHVLTNDKVKDKADCLKDLTKESLKDSAKMIAIPAGLAGAAAGITAVADRFVPEKANKVVEKAAPYVEKVLAKVGKIFKTDVLSKFKALPAPAQAALAVGAAAFAVVAPIMTIAGISHSGKVEGQHEVK